MIEIWGRATAYSKFIMILALVYPASMLYLAWRIEKMYKSYEERQKEKALSSANE